MNWKFTLIDRNNNSTIIDEPVGWDALEISVKRDLDTHGIFFDYQNNDFQFSDLAMRLIRSEYEQYGVEGQMVLVIEEACEGNELEELYRGRLLFSRYERLEGDECNVKIPIETTSDVMQLRNRWDQKVDLQGNVAFDGAPLPAYNKLGFDLTLPSKGILLKDDSRVEGQSTESTVGVLTTPSPSQNGYNVGVHLLNLGMNKEVSSEIGLYGFNSTSIFETIYRGGLNVADGQTFSHQYNNSGNIIEVSLWPLASDVVLNYAEGTKNYHQISNPVQVEFAFNGFLEILNCYLTVAHLIFCRLPADKVGEQETDYQYLFEQTYYFDDFGPPPTHGLPPGSKLNINNSYVDDIDLKDGDRFYLFIIITERKNATQVADGLPGAQALKFTLNEPSYFKVTNLSHTKATPAKAFLINETISRVAEAITNNKIKGYSDYFGRVDSQPYAVAEDGCGSLEALTKGLFIRRQESRVPVQMNVSMKDLWEGLEPVHHIGFGIEEDPQLPGNKRLRVEPWSFFYKKEIVLYLPDVAEIKTKVIENEHYSTFTFGYAKWEAEEYTGLDEFLTKRTYRTSLSQIKNELPKLSKFIASGYALEVTRRKGDAESKDWRYDNDTFLICLERQNTIVLTEAAIIGSTGLLSFYDVREIPSWAVQGQSIDITMTDNDGIPVPANSGTYSIVSAVMVSGLLQLKVTPNFTQTLLIGIVTITVSGLNLLAVELGNISNAQNILDPDTLYNFRISPLRNAMRWMNEVLASYRSINAANQIIFTDGDGNYSAAGEMTSAVCKLENGVLAENQNLSSANFADSKKADPILRPERLTFEYPMSVREFKRLIANPYGLIALSHQSTRFAWIDEVVYKPEEGTASYNLIPIFSISNELLDQLNQFIIDNP